jgi:hypothetical protein
MKYRTILIFIFILLTSHLLPIQSLAQDLPYYLYDRGTGIPTSQFGTYVRSDEMLIYPFYEYYSDKNFEYEPAEFGHASIEELRGQYKAHEGLIFIAYGISDRLALEFEAGIISAELTKAQNDPTIPPDNIKESGLSDVEGQVRWRWNFESEVNPEFFTYFEYVLPTGKENSLIGTSHWELKLGTGVVKGFRWGTTTFRLSVEYDTGENKLGSGEYAIEYLKRLSTDFRFFMMIEGTEDEIAFIPEIQWFITPDIFLKVANGFALTSKATDFAPEIGLMISVFP